MALIMCRSVSWCVQTILMSLSSITAWVKKSILCFYNKAKHPKRFTCCSSPYSSAGVLRNPIYTILPTNIAPLQFLLSYNRSIILQYLHISLYLFRLYYKKSKILACICVCASLCASSQYSQYFL